MRQAYCAKHALSTYAGQPYEYAFEGHTRHLLDVVRSAHTENLMENVLSPRRHV